MMHAQTATSAAPTPTARLSALRFLRWLYDDQAGYVCVVAGTNNASDDAQIDTVETTREWLYVHPERPDLYAAVIDYIDQLTPRYGNVYVTYRLFTKQAKTENKRLEAYTLPSKIIFTDDAPARPALPYSANVQTSETSHHAYYKCDQPATKDDVRRVTAALGGDPSGVVLNKLVRVPGTFNTKRGGRFAITGIAKNRIYTLAQIRDTFPALTRSSAAPKYKNTAATIESPFNTERVATIRTRLDGRTSLLQTVKNSTVKHITKVPARVNPGTLTYKLLTDASERYAWRNASGSWDASRVRWNVCAGLIERGYDADHIIAFLDYLEEPETRNYKTPENLQSDYARLFNADKLGPRYAQKQAEQRQYHARQDRPQQHTAESYYTWLQTQQQDGRVLLKRRERATGAGISTATLDRLEDSLEQSGRIRIETPPDRSGSVVVLCGGVINILVSDAATTTPTTGDEVLSGAIAQSAESCASTGETAQTPIMHKNTPPPGAGSGAVGPDARRAQRAHQGGCVLSARSAAPTLDAALTEALETLPAQRPDVTTGELHRWPVTLRRVREYLRETYAQAMWSDAAIATRYQQIRNQQRGRLWRELRQMDGVTLEKRARALSGAIARDEKRAVCAVDAPLAASELAAYYREQTRKRRWTLEQVGAEIARRDALQAARIEQHGYNTEEVQSLLDLAAQVIEQQPPVKARVPKAAPVADLPAHDVRGLVERLNVLRDQRLAITG